MARKPKAKNEEIFPDTKLRALAVRWKERLEAGEHDEASRLMTEIIMGSTPMFQRFIQHEGFHRTVAVEKLVSVAQVMVPKWTSKWSPTKGNGSLFSWFTACAKNAFKSEVIRETTFRDRYHVTSDNLEDIWGYDDHEVNKDDAAAKLRADLEQMTCRWASEQERGAIKYLLECIVDSENGCDKTRAIASAAYAWGIDAEAAKFFYGWTLIQMRTLFYAQIHMPFTDQDLFRQEHAYSYLVDLLDIITWDQLKKMIAVMGGMRLKLPTIANLAKMSANYDVWRDIDTSDKDPASVAEVAKKHRKSQKTAQQIYHHMCAMLDSRRSGEHSIY